MVLSQVCMVAVGRTFEWMLYAGWGLMCVPAVLFVIVGFRKQSQIRREESGVPRI